MKYIKTYEEKQKLKYKVGDYISLSSGCLTRHMTGQVIEIEIGSLYPYQIEFCDLTTVPVNGREILRYLTEKEIEEFELNKQTNKYNL